jgi:response regulator RpfG family c-di-GMP phosphodiesterase
MVTALDDRDSRLQGIEAGADDFITKPIDRTELRARVHSITRLNRYRRLQEERSKLERQVQRLNALRAIDRAITASVDLHVTLNILLQQVTGQLAVDAAAVLLFNPHTQVLEYIAERGFWTQLIEHKSLRLGEGLAGQAVLDGSRVSVPNLAAVPADQMQADLQRAESFKAYFGVPLVAKGKVVGVLEVFHRTLFTPDLEWLDFLDALAHQAAIAIDNHRLFDGLQRSNLDLILTYDATIEGWSRALDLRNEEVEGHTLRVAEMTLQLARELGIEESELVHLRRGALLHDIGKLGVPDSILLKPGELTDEEWIVMRKHPAYAHTLLSPISYLRPALVIPYCHHEKWDGSGYPRGLNGEQIPLAARIFAVVDVWDELSSDRPYRPRWPEDKIISHMKAESGKHFDPRAVEAFLRMMNVRKPAYPEMYRLNHTPIQVQSAD